MLPEFRLITQNVDGLHRAAGSRRLTELHGCLWRVRCMRDGSIRDERRVPLPEIPPHCECGALLRPHIVWFGEGLDAADLEQAVDAVRRAELVIVVGTSALVEPAASLPRIGRRSGAYLVEINPEETPLTGECQEAHRGPAAALLPRLVGFEEET
jgi:NAD-dependent protein deacetylase/lipoamidase